MEPIRAKYTWSANEYIAAHDLYRQHGAPPVLRLAVIGFGAILVYMAYENIRHGAIGMGVLYIVLALVVLVLRGQLQRAIIRWRFKRRPDADLEIDTTFTEEGLAVEMPGSSGTIEWDHIYRGVIAPEGVLLFMTSRQFRWVPRHAFESEDRYAEFRGLLNDKVSNLKQV